MSHSYGRHQVVEQVSLSVGPGEIHCLLGGSGSGKTTILRLAAGLERLQSGAVYIAGEQVANPSTHVPPERRPIGFVFQDYALFPHLTVQKNILFGVSKNISRVERFARVASLLESVGMQGFQQAMPHTLSGGQQQRVALVRAMARQPSVMLLDEPFSGLDARLRGEVRDVTMRVLKQAGVATLMVTHDPLEAMEVADAISVIDQGKVHQTGTPGDTYYHPTSPQVAEALGEVNRCRGRVTGGHVETPWGAVQAQNLVEDTTVDVLFRPESVVVHCQPTVASTQAIVRSVRFQGQHRGIIVESNDGQTCRVAVADEKEGLDVGSMVHVALKLPEVVVVPQ